MRKDLKGFLQNQYRLYGPVSRTRFGPQHGLLLLGPELSQGVLLDRERNFSSEMGYKRSMSPFFGGGLMLRDFDEHRIHRRIMQTAFKIDTLRGYARDMNELLGEGIRSWHGVENFLFDVEIKQVLLRVAAKIFIGVETRNTGELEQMNQNFLAAVAALNSLLPWDIPGLSFHRGLRGQRRLYRHFEAMLPDKRTEEGNDMFSHFAKERDENGQLYSDDDVIRHIIFLMMAAHDTTTSALSSCLTELVTHRGWQERLRSECLAYPKETLEYDDLEQLPDLDCFMHEVLRVHGPVPMIMRRTVRDLELGGYDVPAHTIIALAPTFSHFMEEWWTEPGQFDPERFRPERAEHKRHSFSYMPFGGGAHKCIGLNFAMMQIKCFLYQILRRHRMRLAPGYEPPVPYQHVPFPHPANQLPLVLEDL